MKNKWVKGIVGVAVGLLLSGLLASCGAEKKPEQTVNNYLEAFKKQDKEAMALYAVTDESAESSTSGMSEMPELLGKITDFDYEILSAEQQDQTASVKVKFTTYDFTSFFGEAFKEAFATAIQGAFSSAFGGEEFNEADSDQALSDAFNNNMSLLDKKSVDFEVDIPLQKTEDGWIISDTNVVMNGILGGAGDYLNQVSEGLQESFNSGE